MSWAKSLKSHILCWTIFIFYESVVNYSYTKSTPRFLDYFGHYLLNICIFYLNAYFIDLAVNRGGKRIIKLTFFILLELAGYLVAKYFMYKLYILSGIYNGNEITSLFVTESLYRAVYFMGLSTGYWFALSSIKKQKTIVHLEKEKLTMFLQNEQAQRKILESENINLKAQINPHFLFNVLGSIHHSLLKFSDDAAEIVALLSDMMRYALQKPNVENWVRLEDELEQIENYILINQYHHLNNIAVIFKKLGDFSYKKISPLLFLTIVENVFKYAELSDFDNPALITIQCDINKVELTISNKKKKMRVMEGFGIGMSNVKKRLDLNYRDNYQLNITDTDSIYTLKLILYDYD